MSIIEISVLLLLLSGCNINEKINEAFTFNFSEEINFTIPASSIVDLPLDFATPDIASGGKQAFENNNTSASLVEKVYLSDLTLEITEPSTRTFSFLKSIQIYIKTNDSNEILLAEKKDISENVTSLISLDTSNENLKIYLQEDTYSIRYKIVTKETTNSRTEITSKLDFKVNATAL